VPRSMCGAIPPLPQYTYMAWCSVKKKDHRDSFVFNDPNNTSKEDK